MCQLANGWSVQCQRARILAVYLHQDWKIPLQSMMIESSNLQLAIFGLSIISYLLYLYTYTLSHTLQRSGPKHHTEKRTPSVWQPFGSKVARGGRWVKAHGAGLQWRSANQGKTSFAAWHYDADALTAHTRHWWKHATSNANISESLFQQRFWLSNSLWYKSVQAGCKKTGAFFLKTEPWASPLLQTKTCGRPFKCDPCDALEPAA